MPESVSAEIERKLQALQRWVVGGLVTMLTFGMAMVGFAGFTTANQASTQRDLLANQQEYILQGKQAHDGILALKEDIQRRRSGLIKYLAENPGPEPIPGITRATLQESLKNYDKSLKALSVVKP